jgi:hypothetical protein
MIANSFREVGADARLGGMSFSPKFATSKDRNRLWPK